MQSDTSSLGPGFRCYRCNRTFTGAQRLVAHSSEHTGVKAYTCTVCARTFSRIDRMRKHYRENHADVIGRDSVELQLVKPRTTVQHKL